MSEQTAYLMIEMLKGVVESGTGVRLRYRYGLMNPIAGKTGTTQNQSDGWFMGLTPDLVAGAWVGCEDRSAHFRSITYGQGAAAALPIWALFMKKVQSDKTINLYTGDFEKPSKPLEIEVDCQEYDKVNRHSEPPIQRNVF
jgi:penicillin-binding protein 1A